MTAIIIMLAVLAGTAAVLYAEHRLYLRRKAGQGSGDTPEEPQEETESECCGLHMTCERDSLLAAVSPEIEYYDDEELDRYAGRAGGDYTPAEADEFRDILLSMQPSDIAGWARSLQLRGVTLPADVREELIMIVAEARAAATRSSHA